MDESNDGNDIVSVMWRVAINGSVAQLSCKCLITKGLWDAKGNRAKGKIKEARDTNPLLDKIKTQIIKHYQHLADRERRTLLLIWYATLIKAS